MWLFEPNSPCIATFNPNTSSVRCCHSHFILGIYPISGNPLDLPGNLPNRRRSAQMQCGEPGRKTGNRLIVRRTFMLWTITIILFILWIVGLVSSYTMGGWIHILLVLAIIMLIFNLMSGRRAL